MTDRWLNTSKWNWGQMWLIYAVKMWNHKFYSAAESSAVMSRAKTAVQPLSLSDHVVLAHVRGLYIIWRVLRVN